MDFKFLLNPSDDTQPRTTTSKPPDITRSSNLLAIPSPSFLHPSVPSHHTKSSPRSILRTEPDSRTQIHAPRPTKALPRQTSAWLTDYQIGHGNIHAYLTVPSTRDPQDHIVTSAVGVHVNQFNTNDDNSTSSKRKAQPSLARREASSPKVTRETCTLPSWAYMSVPAPPKTITKPKRATRTPVFSNLVPTLVLPEAKANSYSQPRVSRNQDAVKCSSTSARPQKRRLEDISAILESEEARKKAKSRDKAVELKVGEGEEAQPKMLCKTKIREEGGWMAFAAVEE